MLEGNVLITGGAGFLGRGIMRQAKREGWPVRFTVYSRDETKQAQVRREFPDARYVLGDICDANHMAMVALGHRYVIHAAAIKYIPEAEFNAAECVRVNIDGARAVIEACRFAGVERCVGISTDKASQPVNVYGMTKAVMERLFAEAAQQWETTFTTCRYGNVIGSTGSVVPAMIQSFRERGWVEITDPFMTRFWMSVSEAVNTIQYAFRAPAGSTTVPTPYASTMHCLAEAVLDYLGEPIYEMSDERDERIHAIGRRPGEKQHEDLISNYEMFRTRPGNPGAGFYLIMPPGAEDYSVNRATISSDKVDHLTRSDLVNMIRDSVLV